MTERIGIASNCVLMTSLIANTLFQGKTLCIGKSAHFALGHAKKSHSDQHGHDFRHLPFDNDQSVRLSINCKQNKLGN
jgi:hypothetical protein